MKNVTLFCKNYFQKIKIIMKKTFITTVYLVTGLFICAISILAQSATASLSGTVFDANGAVVSGANVKIANNATAFEQTRTTNGDGYFIFSQLAPSSYVLTVEQSGFTASQTNIVLNVNDQSNLRVQLKIEGASATVEVNDAAALIEESPTVKTVVDRQFIENQPLNGRSFQNLVELSPGVVIAPSNLPNPGQFSVNGQRTGSNYFTVDGVSANFGSTASVTLYETAGGGVPSYSALGTTSSLASVDAVQEFAIQTSTYAPEFGRQPGAQVSLVTRSGTNEYHGSVFDYVRNDVFDANNFFDNANGFEKQPLRQNDFGVTFGGPLPFLNFGEGVPVFNSGKDRTFFFFSYEGLRLRSPGRTDNDLEVPTVAARNNATGALRDILRAFPLPNRQYSAAEEADGVVDYFSNFTNPSRLDAISLRVDHTFNSRVSVFGRYNYAPSEDQQRARFCAASCVADLTYKTQTFTVGSTQIFSNNITNNLRVNFSKSKVNQTYFIDDFGGAVIPPQSSLYPSFTNRNNGYFYFEVNPTGSNTLSDGLFSDNKQRQFNIVNSTSITFGGHTVKFGVDYRRLTPVSFSGTYKRAFLPDNIQDVINNVPTFAQIIAPQVTPRPIYENFSLFAQDTWRVNPRLTLTYGLRYEIVPAPDEENGNLPLTVLGLQEGSFNLANLSLSSTRQKFYETTYNNFAPRVGAAYRLFENTVVRGGFGVFYDLGYNFTGSAFSTGILPFSNTLTLPSVRYDSPLFQQQVPPVSLNPPYSRVFAYEPDFELPYSLQYNFSVEQGFGANNTISVSYVGAKGERLGRVETLRSSTGNFLRLDLVTNGGYSNYNALQVQYQRRLTRGFQALVSYTFGKSLDNVSEETQNNLQSPTGKFDPGLDYAPSSFDVRHSFNGAISYEIPSPFENGLAKKIFGGFGIDAIFRARTATPVNIVTNSNALGLGVRNILRPDYVEGQPLYIEDNTAPGGRRFNRDAFVIPNGRQGTLGRNALRGFPARQLDLSLRRQFNLTERINLQLRADGFNVFNTSNFANPTGVLTSGSFGVATRTLASGLGGLSSLYQIGGPRSFQLSAKLKF